MMRLQSFGDKAIQVGRERVVLDPLRRLSASSMAIWTLRLRLAGIIGAPRLTCTFHRASASTGTAVNEEFQ
jgi:hypothetical protein